MKLGSVPQTIGIGQSKTPRQLALSAEENPFPGGRPFLRGESDRFEGRESETADLSSVLRAQNCVLLYAPSGAGKTSLINAGVIPNLQIPERRRQPIIDAVKRWESDEEEASQEKVENDDLPGDDRVGHNDSDDVLPVELEVIRSGIAARYFDVLGVTSVKPGSLRGPTGWPSASLVRNVYTTAAVQGLRGWKDQSTSLAEYLKRRPRVLDEFGDLLPRLVVFDQFEELLEPYGRDDWLECRDSFMSKLAHVVGGDPPLHVLIAIREDHLATVERLSSRAGLTFGARYRLDKLRKPSARRSIVIPAAESGLPFADKVADGLVEDLAMRRVSGIPEPLPGEFIEPAQLQVVCRQVWSAANAEPPKEGKDRKITKNHISMIGGVEGGLRVQYENAIHSVDDQYVQTSTERAVRRFFEDQLISDGTRQLVAQNQPPRRKRDRIPPGVFEELETTSDSCFGRSSRSPSSSSSRR